LAPPQIYILPLHDALPISLAPDALRIPRREAIHVALAVDRLPNPVDPAEAQRFLDRLFPGHGRLLGRLFVVAHPDVIGRCVMLLDRKSTRLNSSHVKISYA